MLTNWCAPLIHKEEAQEEGVDEAQAHDHDRRQQELDQIVSAHPAVDPLEDDGEDEARAGHHGGDYQAVDDGDDVVARPVVAVDTEDQEHGQRQECAFSNLVEPEKDGL